MAFVFQNVKNLNENKILKRIICIFVNPKILLKLSYINDFWVKCWLCSFSFDFPDVRSNIVIMGHMWTICHYIIFVIHVTIISKINGIWHISIYVIFLDLLLIFGYFDFWLFFFGFYFSHDIILAKKCFYLFYWNWWFNWGKFCKYLYFFRLWFSFSEMEASEPKWVNPVLDIMGLTHLVSEIFKWND